MESIFVDISQEPTSPETRPQASLDETMLATYKVEKQTKIECSSENKVYLLKLKDDGSGVYKPSRGEHESGRVVELGTCYLRERAAFIVDREIGFNLIPPTVVRKLNQGQGSVQRFIEDYKWFDTSQETVFRDQLVKLFLLDYVIHNSDRHRFNLLVKNNQLFAIDNGYSFCTDDRLLFFTGVTGTNYLQYFKGEPAPKESIDMILSFSQDNAKVENLKNLLQNLLNPSEIESCISRISKLSDAFKNSNLIPDLTQHIN
jgi:hypothetical protein